MLILGIETSCDETAAAVVRDGKTILSNIVVSSLREHAKYGGIIPEIASRRQMECIQAVVREALEKAKTSLDDIDAIAVTTSPGLMGSLLVGISFARALSFAIKKPLIEVDHIHAHLYANFLSFEHEPKAQPKLPAAGLVVSGGHTSLYHVKKLTEFKLIGQTRDDAAGEAFDKVAKILELGYPGGPVIDRLAKTADKRSRLKFNYAEIPNSLDFSFSGVKTAVLYHHRDHKQEKGFSVNDVAAAFQDSVVAVLVKKCIMACRKYKTRTLLIGGGVAANSALRETLAQACEDENIKMFFPPISLCLDNASMIAGLAHHLY